MRGNIVAMLRIAWILVLMLSAPAALADVSASVDRNPVRLGETVRLVLDISGESNAGGFDAAPLEADFEVLGTASTTRINIVGGRQQTTTRLIVDIAPRREGALRIPPLSLDAGTSNPIDLTVLAAAAPSTADTAEVTLELSVDREKVYVQAPMVLTARLSLGVPLLGGNLSDPVVEDAVVQRIGEDDSYASQVGGVRRQVIERRFLVYPQRSGSLEIPALRFDGETASGSSSRGLGGLFSQGRRVRAVSDSVVVEVLPPAVDFVGGRWLPASEVRLIESWPDDPPVFVVGKPVTRTLRIEADGVLGEQIPDIAIDEVADMRHYPDRAEIDTVYAADRVTGLREQRVALVPARAGTFTLPGVELSWWDVDTDTARVARIPPRSIEILPAPAVAGPPTAPESAPSVDPGLANAPLVATGGRGPWPWISLVFALLWLATLALWWRGGRQKEPAAAMPGSAPSTRALRRVCSGVDPRAARSALLAWGRSRWPLDPPLGLEQLAARIDASLAAEFRDLDAACYAPGSGSWGGHELWQRLAPFLDMGRGCPPTASPLPNLYPDRRAA